MISSIHNIIYSCCEFHSFQQNGHSDPAMQSVTKPESLASLSSKTAAHNSKLRLNSGKEMAGQHLHTTGEDFKGQFYCCIYCMISDRARLHTVTRTSTFACIVAMILLSGKDCDVFFHPNVPLNS